MQIQTSASERVEARQAWAWLKRKDGGVSYGKTEATMSQNGQRRNLSQRCSELMTQHSYLALVILVPSASPEKGVNGARPLGRSLHILSLLCHAPWGLEPNKA